MAKKQSKRNEAAPLRFDEKLVLNQWMLSLFDAPTFEKLAERLRVLELEGLDENNVHLFHKEMRILWEFEEFPGDTLLTYDQNIVKHTQRLSEKRPEPLRWKYFSISRCSSPKSIWTGFFVTQTNCLLISTRT